VSFALDQQPTLEGATSFLPVVISVPVSAKRFVRDQNIVKCVPEMVSDFTRSCDDVNVQARGFWRRSCYQSSIGFRLDELLIVRLGYLHIYAYNTKNAIGIGI
jgi:hypothetical protein